MASKTVINVSPKVLTGGLFGLGVAVVEAVTASVTPASLHFLGGWEPLALAALPPLLGQVAAWFKKEEQAAEAPPAVQAQVANTHDTAPVEPASQVGPVTEPLVPQTADQIIAGPAA